MISYAFILQLKLLEADFVFSCNFTKEKERYIMQRHFRPKSQRRGPREFRGQTLFINEIKGFY